MAIVSLSAPRRFVLFAAIVSAYRRWRWSRLRTLCETCAACGREIDAEALRLLHERHWRAAVCMARLRLELELSDLCRGLNDADKPWLRTGRHMVPFLKRNDRITARQANRISAVYTRASKIVHGGACSPARAKGIVYDTRNVIKFLRSAEPMAAGGAV